MRYIYSSILLVLISFSSYSTLANADEPNQSPTIKLYTQLYLRPISTGNLNFPADISLIINGELVVAKNHTGGMEAMLPSSYIEVDRKYDLKEISEAKFNYLSQGKWMHCAATDMPRYVQKGEFGVGTQLTFECS